MEGKTPTWDVAVKALLPTWDCTPVMREAVERLVADETISRRDSAGKMGRSRAAAFLKTKTPEIEKWLEQGKCDPRPPEGL